jgi:hypothetical protein
MDALPRVVSVVMAVFNCKARGVMEFAQAAVLAMGAKDGPHRGFVEAHLPQLVCGSFLTSMPRVLGTAPITMTGERSGKPDDYPVF